MGLARVLHGLTTRRLAVLAAFGAVFSLFSFPVALSYARGLSATKVALAFGQTYLGAAVWFIAGLIAGVATFNCVRGSLVLRAAATLGVVGIVAILTRPLSLVVRGVPWRSAIVDDPHVFNMWVSYVSLTALAVAAIVYLTRGDDDEHALELEARRAIDLARGLDEARLKAMQAQIEPHFLFNTLANIRRLCEVDPTAAGTMLRQFTRMLAQALPDIRTERSTLAREVALALAYLGVQKIRMGERLAFATRIPSHLRDAALPPMMLSTLVENAIKHGLAPLPEGGQVTISAQGEREALRVIVADTGRGLRESAGGGIGLANIQTRLTALFGDAGALELESNEHGGVTATLKLPLTMELTGQADVGVAS